MLCLTKTRGTRVIIWSRYMCRPKDLTCPGWFHQETLMLESLSPKLHPSILFCNLCSLGTQLEAPLSLDLSCCWSQCLEGLWDTPPTIQCPPRSLSLSPLSKHRVAMTPTLTSNSMACGLVPDLQQLPGVSIARAGT